MSEEQPITKAQVEEIMAEQQLRFNAVDLLQVNLEPGDVLIATIKSDDINMSSMNSIGDYLRKTFPNNKVLVMGVESSGDIKFTVAKDASVSDTKSACGPGPTNYCNDCSCGKKAAYEGKQMRLLALTDVMTGEAVEFVVVEKIQHIQPFKQEVITGTETVELTEVKTLIQRIFGLDASTISVAKHTKKTLTGSTIYMDNGHGTHVLETPENIAEMLAEGNFITIEKGE